MKRGLRTIMKRGLRTIMTMPATRGCEWSKHVSKSAGGANEARVNLLCADFETCFAPSTNSAGREHISKPDDAPFRFIMYADDACDQDGDDPHATVHIRALVSLKTSEASPIG